jgi:hypothetical protein
VSGAPAEMSAPGDSSTDRPSADARHPTGHGEDPKIKRLRVIDPLNEDVEALYWTRRSSMTSAVLPRTVSGRICQQPPSRQWIGRPPWGILSDEKRLWLTAPFAVGIIE